MLSDIQSLTLFHEATMWVPDLMPVKCASCFQKDRSDIVAGDAGEHSCEL